MIKSIKVYNVVPQEGNYTVSKEVWKQKNVKIKLLKKNETGNSTP